MTQRLIAVVGVSGVGKSTFLKAAGEFLTFKHLTAGSLIGKAGAEKYEHDSLRLQDIDENQELLVRGFARAKKTAGSLIILDAHTVIHGAAGLEVIGPRVFAALKPDAIAHVEADPAEILANRMGDQTRERPLLSIEDLADQQALSRAAAMEIAYTLSIPFKIFTHRELSDFCSFASASA
ncbi:AAA family ATPase [Rhizobium anhuiense]|uniref:AAA family ATPase n=1 Tax=Rhizobium anhuiense TaxID=1184720 RepID=UPI0020CC5BED|nr:AAA family ATPase [Rhizobium anhuiense]UTS88165.1 AAA family ATPase [Rhizobium anhuiense bv. trifolii]